MDLFNSNRYIDEKAPKEDECVMACNPNHYPFFVGSRKDIGVLDDAATFTTENHDVDYSGT
jgi:hypothetical protein